MKSWNLSKSVALAGAVKVCFPCSVTSSDCFRVMGISFKRYYWFSRQLVRPNGNDLHNLLSSAIISKQHRCWGKVELYSVMWCMDTNVVRCISPLKGLMRDCYPNTTSLLIFMMRKRTVTFSLCCHAMCLSSKADFCTIWFKYIKDTIGWFSFFWCYVWCI
jgi:hypothetical protein